jgi:hypothetical protein
MTCKGFEIRGLRNIVIIFRTVGRKTIHMQHDLKANVPIIIFT